MSARTTAGDADPGLLERYGACLSRRRNLLFPAVTALIAAAGILRVGPPRDPVLPCVIGLALVGTGQAPRILVVGLEYIMRGGVD